MGLTAVVRVCCALGNVSIISESRMCISNLGICIFGGHRLALPLIRALASQFAFYILCYKLQAIICLQLLQLLYLEGGRVNLKVNQLDDLSPLYWYLCIAHLVGSL